MQGPSYLSTPLCSTEKLCGLSDGGPLLPIVEGKNLSGWGLGSRFHFVAILVSPAILSMAHFLPAYWPVCLGNPLPILETTHLVRIGVQTAKASSSSVGCTLDSLSCLT